MPNAAAESAAALYAVTWIPGSRMLSLHHRVVVEHMPSEGSCGTISILGTNKPYAYSRPPLVCSSYTATPAAAAAAGAPPSDADLLFGVNTDTGPDGTSLTRFERLPVTIYPSARDASAAVAGDIAALIRQRQAEGRKVRLMWCGAFATGVQTRCSALGLLLACLLF